MRRNLLLITAVFFILPALPSLSYAQGAPVRLELKPFPPPADGIVRCKTGDELQIQLAGYDAKRLETSLNQYRPTASSSNAEVAAAEVPPNTGQQIRLRCLSEGSAKITASYREASASLTVQVGNGGQTTPQALIDQPLLNRQSSIKTPPLPSPSPQNTVNADTLDGIDSSGFVQTNTTAFVRNQTAQQTADFNVSGKGTANVFDAKQYNINGNRVLSFPGNNSFTGFKAGLNNTAGDSNSFFGEDAGSGNTTGYMNSFFGRAAGNANTTGNHNTIIGFGANVASGNLEYATAIGAGAIVTTSNTIVLGSNLAVVRIPRLSAAGSTTVCLNSQRDLSVCSSSLRYKTNVVPFAFGLNFINQLKPISFDWKDGGMKDVGFGAEDVARVNPLFVTFNQKGEAEGVKYDRLSVLFVNAFKEQQAQIERQQIVIDALLKLVCQQNSQAEVCKQGK